MKKIWIITGWHRDQDWFEGAYSNYSATAKAVNELYDKRDSVNGPKDSIGLQKFGLYSVELWDKYEAKNHPSHSGDVNT